MEPQRSILSHVFHHSMGGIGLLGLVKINIKERKKNVHTSLVCVLALHSVPPKLLFDATQDTGVLKKEKKGE